MSGFGPTDRLVASALGGSAPWPRDVDESTGIERAIYHGIAGILTDHPSRIATWPAPVRDRLREQALLQTMWEIRHKLILSSLLDRLAESGIAVRLLKGSAIAYHLYPRPAQRVRGDSDILIAPADLGRARAVLSKAGFMPFLDTAASAADRLQEPWTLAHADGSTHDIDLHWAALNSPLLDQVLPIDLAMERPQPLPALGSHALALPLDLALIHACLHRAGHALSPYFVDGVTHYGGDRLIWLVDIDFLWRALDRGGRKAVITRALESGVGPVIGAALGAAHEQLAMPLADDDYATLCAGPKGAATRYLTSDAQAGRALRDLSASPGIRGKLRYLTNRLFPPAEFMRAKYPQAAARPLILLYVRRFLSFWKPRPRQSL